MKSIVALLVLGFGLASASQDALLCKCPKMYTPVCGSDGVTYNNLCLLRCEQKVNKGLTAAKVGPCEEQKVFETAPMCPCPRIFSPVCGSDGVTYNNPCLLNCQKQANNDLTAVHQGACKKEMPCICTREYFPVCGSDGVTYSNECMFKCQQRQTNGLTMAHMGECTAKNEIMEDVCICTEEFAPVCGSDGVTYPNKCQLMCKQRSNSDLTVANQGQCKTMNVEEDVCICTMEYAPVCGSNGVTYGNMCNLKCQQRSNSGLTVAHQGECQMELKQNVCICTLEYAPVCGSDGVTYPSKCNLNCKMSTNKGLTMVHNGRCNM